MRNLNSGFMDGMEAAMMPVLHSTLEVGRLVGGGMESSTVVDGTHQVQIVKGAESPYDSISDQSQNEFLSQLTEEIARLSVMAQNGCFDNCGSASTTTDRLRISELAACDFETENSQYTQTHDTGQRDLCPPVHLNMPQKRYRQSGKDEIRDDVKS